MVLFFCSFLALRSQDYGKPVQDIRDDGLEGEELIYKGEVTSIKIKEATDLLQPNCGR
jgi:hypothetical protein